jgi:hypothetical protein
MILAVSRFALLMCASVVILTATVRAEPVTIEFTARIGSGNSIDTDNVFNPTSTPQSKI